MLMTEGILGCRTLAFKL